MKAIIICALLIAFGVSAQADHNKLEEKLEEYAEACMTARNLKKEDFEKFEKNYQAGTIDTVTDDMKCALHCITQKMGAMDENGKMQFDNIKAMIDDDDKRQKFEAAYKNCNAVTAANPCETAFQTFACLVKQKAM